MAAKQLFIVGKNIGDKENEWEFAGVFDTEAAADAACRTHDYFYGAAELNEELPDEASEWPYARRPRSA